MICIGISLFVFLRHKNFVFNQFICKRLRLAHSINTSASFLNLLRRWSEELTESYNVVSSANKIVKKFDTKDKPLIKMIKRSGPSMDPCGTPKRIGSRSEKLFFIFVFWKRFVKYFFTNRRAVKSKPDIFKTSGIASKIVVLGL